MARGYRIDFIDYTGRPLERRLRIRTARFFDNPVSRQALTASERAVDSTASSEVPVAASSVRLAAGDSHIGVRPMSAATEPRKASMESGNCDIRGMDRGDALLAGNALV